MATTSSRVAVSLTAVVAIVAGALAAKWSVYRPARTGAIGSGAAVLTVALALAGCSGSLPGSGVSAATSIVSVSPLNADGRIRADWNVKQDPPADDLAPWLDCWGPSDWALGPNIQSCGATAEMLASAGRHPAKTLFTADSTPGRKKSETCGRRRF